MKRISTLILCFISFIAWSQKNFVAGSITLPSGRSEKGFIDYREWKMNPQKILFRKLSGVWVDYSSNDILEFRIDEKNEIYKQVVFDKSYNSGIAKKSKSLFLLTLLQGKINLYIYRDADDEAHYYIQKDDESIFELIYKGTAQGYTNSISPNQNAYYTVTTNVDVYKKQLLRLMEDSPSLHHEINNLILTQNNITALVKKYNQKKKNLTYIKPKDDITNSINLVGGVAYSDLVVEEYFTGYNKKDHIGVSSPTFSIGFERSLPRSNGRFSVGAEGFYQQNKADFTLNNRNIKKQYSIDVTGIRLNGFVKYIMYKGKWAQPYIKGGVGVANYFKRELTTHVESSINATQSRKLSQLDPALMGGFGLKLRAFFIETRCELGSNIDFKPGEKFKTNRATIMAGYSWQLGK